MVDIRTRAIEPNRSGTLRRKAEVLYLRCPDPGLKEGHRPRGKRQAPDEFSLRYKAPKYKAAMLREMV